VITPERLFGKCQNNATQKENANSCQQISDYPQKLNTFGFAFGYRFFHDAKSTINPIYFCFINVKL